MKKNFFSIMIPVYNAEKHLAECVYSILNQTLGDFEVILIDDGSTDKSGLICEDIADKDHRFKVYHQYNQGLLLARRNAIKKAQGEYYVFLDADDALKCDALEILKKTIIAESPDIIIFRASLDKDFKIPFRENLYPGGKRFVGGEIVDIKRIVCSSYSLNNFVLKCVKASCVDREKDYTPFKFIQSGEDLLQTLPLIDKASCIVYIDSMLYFYRQNPKSITHTFNPNIFYSFKELAKTTIEYASKWSNPDNDLVYPTCFFYLTELPKCVLHVVKGNKDFRFAKEMLSIIASDELFLKMFNESSHALDIKNAFVLKCLFNRHYYLLYLSVKMYFFLLVTLRSKIITCSK